MADGQSTYKMEAWDFLTPLEARQCLNMKIKKENKDPINQANIRYDAMNINKDYIAGSDIAIMVYDVSKPQTLEWCKAEANRLAAWGVRKIIFAANKSDADPMINFDEQNDWF